MSDRRSFLVAAFGGVLGVLGLRHAGHIQRGIWNDYTQRWEGMVPPNPGGCGLFAIKKGDTFTIQGETYTPLLRQRDGTLRWGAPRLREFIAE